jgi:hypothetical protein
MPLVWSPTLGGLSTDLPPRCEARLAPYPFVDLRSSRSPPNQYHSNLLGANPYPDNIACNLLFLSGTSISYHLPVRRSWVAGLVVSGYILGKRVTRRAPPRKRALDRVEARATSIKLIVNGPRVWDMSGVFIGP